jgi:hypothetical protein
MLNVPEEIKELLHQDSCQKNIRIHFPGQERSDICNDMIVMDSVSFTESLCSQNTLKFGLCEYPVFECEVVGVGNITGARIIVSCEIYCDQTITGAVWRSDLMAYVYPIPYGTFTVQSAKRQADMIHRKIVAYGGTSFLADVDPTIARKTTNYSWSVPIGTTASVPDYTFNIFATSIINAGITGGLSNASYSSVTPSTYTISTGYRYYFWKWDYESSHGYSYAEIRIKCKGVYDNNDDVNSLYYATRDPSYKTMTEVVADLKAQMRANPMFSMTDAKIDECFEKFTKSSSYFDYPEKIIGLGRTYYSIAMANGQYVYPYQYINTDTSILCMVPYEIDVYCAYRNQMGQTTTRTYTSSFADDTKIELYSVDISNYPQNTMSYPRVVIKTDSNTKRYNVTEEIDYYKLTKDMAELNGVFFNVTRGDSVKLLNIKQQFGLLPEENLYPDTDLYPGSPTGGKILPEDYQTCWYDDYYIKPYGAISCPYINTDNEPCGFTYYLNVSDEIEELEDGTFKTYEISDNSIINTSKWTQEQIQAICETIAANIEGVTYMPVEFTGRGLPYVEAGDTFEILTASNDSITTIVLNRTLSGEQVLTDSYKSV